MTQEKTELTEERVRKIFREELQEWARYFFDPTIKRQDKLDFQDYLKPQSKSSQHEEHALD